MNRMPSDFPAQSVLARLEWGHDRAHPIGSLCEALGWPRRAVEQAVQDLRLQGKAIASGSGGIWLTADYRELEATYLSLRGRIRSQSVTAWAVRSTARRLRDGSVQQQTLGWEAA